LAAHEPAQAAAESQAGDSGRRDLTSGHGEPVHRRLPVELAPVDATLSANRARGRVDVDALHLRQVDHQPAVRYRAAGDVVTAAAD